jgi:hypothetical protein
MSPESVAKVEAGIGVGHVSCKKEPWESASAAEVDEQGSGGRAVAAKQRQKCGGSKAVAAEQRQQSKGSRVKAAEQR